jgi:hypothetical protein
MDILETPFAVFIIAAAAQWLAAYAGDFVRNRGATFDADDREDFNLVRNAALTLLALIIGFSFSMAVSRYDQRKDYEEAEANAVGTEYVRADLLPPDVAAKVREHLSGYVDQRILFYVTRDPARIRQIDSDTEKLKANLWSAVSRAAAARPTPVAALAVSGMNDVLNSQGYTQAAWWNRIPAMAWGLMGLIAISCNFLIGYGDHRTRALVLSILPVIVSISFFLIADIDSPRGGIINVPPQNLILTSQFMKSQRPL